MQPILSEKLPHLVSLLRNHHIKRAYAFGSAVSGDFTSASDIDLLVDVDDTLDPVVLGEHLWNLQFELEELFGRNVDLLTSRSLKNPYFIKEVNRTKQLIYE